MRAKTGKEFKLKTGYSFLVFLGGLVLTAIGMVVAGNEYSVGIAVSIIGIAIILWGLIWFYLLTGFQIRRL